MRAFVGLPVPDVVADALEDIQARCPVGRLVWPENFHITLAFLDEQPQEALAALHDGLSAIAAPELALRISGLDVFGGARPRVVFAGVAPDPALVGLRDRVRAAARVAGIDLPHERFRPHITLARLGKRWRGDEEVAFERFMADAAGLILPPFTADRFCLYESTLHSDGPVYEPLAEYPLGDLAVPDARA